MAQLKENTSALDVHLKEYEMLKNALAQDLSMQHQLTDHISVTAVREGGL